MSDIVWMVDAALAERLETVAAAAGRRPYEWIAALLNDEAVASPWGDMAVSTMGGDPNGSYIEAEATMPFDLRARIVIHVDEHEIDARQIPIGGGATYCGVFLPDDDFFGGPLLVLGSLTSVPMTLAAALSGRPLGDVVSADMPALESRTIIESENRMGADSVIRVEATPSNVPALRLRLGHADRVPIAVPRWLVPMKMWPEDTPGRAEEQEMQP